MLLNLHLFRALRAVFVASLAPFAAGAQAPCAPHVADSLAAAWTAYRAGALEAAAVRFRRADSLCPSGVEGRLGLGFIGLRQDRLREADSLFRLLLAHDSVYADAWDGHARSAWGLGDTTVAIDAARRALRLDPRNADLRAWLDRVAPDRDRPAILPRPRHVNLQLVARTRGDRFEVRGSRGWTPFYVQGVNLGVALPGRFPAEFPLDSALYAGWLDTIAGMGANTVRVYTILPPAFYQALGGWNRTHPARALWLVHGVWTELPPGNDFDDAPWKENFRREMRRVADVVHGAAEIPRRPGHAAGRYDADVSRWTLAYLIGREWEPYAVKAYDGRPGAPNSYRGRYLDLAQGTPIDAWMAAECDYLLGYEVATYNALRPIAYTNWPTLDPLNHTTESTAEEERRWRKEPEAAPAATGVSHEEDAVSLDASLVRPTAANPAGWFASYHVYPYYPDFMNYDPGYLKASSSEGPSTYFGYLTELKRHHTGVPLLVAEYGVPSSRGVAHLQPQGWDHGGHDETAMAAIDARLTREIRESGAAGGILFAWMDEWFKRNWIVANYEIPADHTPRWHNAMDAEQHYGILAQRAGPSDRPVPGGDPEQWQRLTLLQSAQGAIGPVRVGSDEAFLYFALPLAGDFGWDSLDLQLAIDTYAPELGQRRIAGSAIASGIGFEFLADFRAPGDAQLLVTPDYNPYAPASWVLQGDDFGRFYRHPASSVVREDGRFDSLFVITNRARYGRDGAFFPARGYDRGRLRFGRETGSTLADWFHDTDAGLLELRLPWGLLNVTDPSTATVLAEREGAPFATATTDGIRLGVLVRRSSDGAVLETLPTRAADGTWPSASFRSWRWPTWTEPTSHAALKPVYDSLKATWSHRAR